MAGVEGGGFTWELPFSVDVNGASRSPTGYYSPSYDDAKWKVYPDYLE